MFPFFNRSFMSDLSHSLKLILVVVEFTEIKF